MERSSRAGRRLRSLPGIWADTVGTVPDRWTIDELRAACTRKWITCIESNGYRRIRGMTVVCGRTAVISLRASLPEDEKIFACAQQLGLLALGHLTSAVTSAARPESWPPRRHPRTSDQASTAAETDEGLEARVWAAHLLLQRGSAPESASAAGRLGRSDDSDRDPRQSGSPGQVAAALNVPRAAVELWRETRGRSFRVPPHAWLALPREWWPPPVPRLVSLARASSRPLSAEGLVGCDGRGVGGRGRAETKAIVLAVKKRPPGQTKESHDARSR